MARAQIHTFIILLLSYLTTYVSAVNNRGKPRFHIQPGPLVCWALMVPEHAGPGPLAEDCRAAFQSIPSGRLISHGGNSPTGLPVSDTLAQQINLLPAAFHYRSCSIMVSSQNVQPVLGSVTEAMSYGAWSAAREAAKRILQFCTSGDRVGGSVMQSLTLERYDSFNVLIAIDHSALTPPVCRIHDAESGGMERVPRRRRPWCKGCMGRSATVE
jgi:hypothetical protein